MKRNHSVSRGLEASGRIIRLGLIYPPGGADQEYYQFAEAFGDSLRIYLVTTRLYGNEKDHDLDSLLKTGNVSQLETAARKLKELKPDSVIWACTSGSFVGGVEWAESQVKAISFVCQCPAGSTSLAFINALNTLDVKRVAVMATYPEVIARRFIVFLNERGIEASNLIWLDEISGWDAALIPAEKIKASVRRADKPDAEAILVPDTAIPTLSLIESLEQEMGKPVITANQVTLWEGLRLAGVQVDLEGWGRLLASLGRQ